MRRASPLWTAVGVVLATIFVARAAAGVRASLAYARGSRGFEQGAYEGAIAPLDVGAIGASRVEGLWLGGEARLGVWDTLPADQRDGARGKDLLNGAASKLLAGRAASPASPWFEASLAGVYARREGARRARAAIDLSLLDRGPWAFVGDDGRTAIGLVRGAILLEPNTVEFRDQLVMVLLANGLKDEAFSAVEDSARVVPDFGAHPGLSYEALPREVVEHFWSVSRTVTPDQVPLASHERHLLSLGILGRRLGHLDEAEADLRAALAAPGTEFFHAEDAFHLALVLVDRGRADEAIPYLNRANAFDVFGPAVATTRARIAESRGDVAGALDRLHDARRLAPRDLGILLDFARVAEKLEAWDQAEEALRWARVVHPTDPAPDRAMIELSLRRGEPGKAREAVDHLRALVGPTDEVAELERRVTSALDHTKP